MIYYHYNNNQCRVLIGNIEGALHAVNIDIFAMTQFDTENEHDQQRKLCYESKTYKLYKQLLNTVDEDKDLLLYSPTMISIKDELINLFKCIKTNYVLENDITIYDDCLCDLYYSEASDIMCAIGDLGISTEKDINDYPDSDYDFYPFKPDVDHISIVDTVNDYDEPFVTDNIDLLRESSFLPQLYNKEPHIVQHIMDFKITETAPIYFRDKICRFAFEDKSLQQSFKELSGCDEIDDGYVLDDVYLDIHTPVYYVTKDSSNIVRVFRITERRMFII